MQNKSPRLHTDRCEDYQFAREALNVFDSETDEFVGKIVIKNDSYSAHINTFGEPSEVFKDRIKYENLTEYDRANYLAKSLNAIWKSIHPDHDDSETILILGEQLKLLIDLAEKGLIVLNDAPANDPRKAHLQKMKEVAEKQGFIKLHTSWLPFIIHHAMQPENFDMAHSKGKNTNPSKGPHPDFIPLTTKSDEENAFEAYRVFDQADVEIGYIEFGDPEFNAFVYVTPGSDTGTRTALTKFTGNPLTLGNDEAHRLLDEGLKAMWRMMQAKPEIPGTLKIASSELKPLLDRASYEFDQAGEPKDSGLRARIRDLNEKALTSETVRVQPQELNWILNATRNIIA